jgi:hypothetical protein
MRGTAAQPNIGAHTGHSLNELLKSLHTFSDWALLRRDLYEVRLLDRSLDGRRYWKIRPPT